MPLFMFRCPQGHRTERLCAAVVQALDCGCGARAGRESVYLTAQGGRQRAPVAERPVLMRQYREASEQLAYGHARAEESAQQPLAPPPLFRMAKAKAQRLQAAGVHDALDYRTEHSR